MLQTMTGFGRSQKIIKGQKFTLDIRSLNSKQLDINLRIPTTLKGVEPHLRNIVAKAVERGKVDGFLTVEAVGDEATSAINSAVVKNYCQQLMQINKELNLPNDNLLSAVLQLPSAFSEENFDDDEITNGLKEMCNEAVTQLENYRKQEGADLEKVFIANIAKIESIKEKVADLAPIRLEKQKAKIINALNQLQVDIDSNRLEQELIYYIEKWDLNEELVRLKTNCQLFKEALATDAKRKGKKLGFVAQEIGREINTLGSKANNSDIQHLVIQMKDELEQIKEQVLNTL